MNRTLKEVVKENITDILNTDSGFLGKYDRELYPFMAGYLKNVNSIDTQNLYRYSEFFIDESKLDFAKLWQPPIFTEIDVIHSIVKSVLDTNYYKYNNLYKSTILNYTLLDNIDLNIEETITDTHGEVVHSFDKGERNSTNVTGSQKVTDNYGAKSEDSKDYTTTFESDENFPTTSKKRTESTYIDSHNTDARTDTTVETATSDLDTVSEYTDIHKTVRHEFGDSSLRSVASGIKEERQISFFSLYELIYDDVMREMLIYNAPNSILLEY